MKVAKNARVAFQGERGAFSEEAAVKLLGEEIALVPRPTFEAAFSAISDGVADYFSRRSKIASQARSTGRSICWWKAV